MVVRALALAALLSVQQAPEITVGLRPQAIRVGDRAVLTVRVVTLGAFPDRVDFMPPEGVHLEDVTDRSSAGAGPRSSWVLETRFHLLGEVAGEYPLPPVQVTTGGVTAEHPSPALTVAASPLAWPEAQREPRNRREGAQRQEADPLIVHGVPPSSGEMAEARPQAQGGYGQWGYPGYVPGYSGQLPGLAPGMFLGYPGSWYSPHPYGPNGGWPIAPPGSTPGMGPIPGQGGWQGWPAPVPGQGYPPGMIPGWQGGNPGISPSPGAVTPVPPGSSGTQGVPTLPAIPGGRWPEGMGGGWAETAAGDPWWPEIVPELFQYDAGGQSSGGDVSLLVGMTPRRVFVGQQATLVATASFRPGAFLGQGASPEYLPPSPPDFWVVDLPEATLALPTASQGGVDQAYTFRRALFPMQAGEYLIPPATLLLPTVGGGGEVWDSVSTESMPLTVLPIPRTQSLPGYRGAVGRYRLEAGVTPPRLAVGEAALLVVRVLGVGNVREIPTPEIPPLFGAEISPAGDGAVVEVRDGVVGGVRSFTWLLVPTEPGPLRIDPILFGYFDPFLGDFGQVASEELVLEVTEFPGG